MIIMKKRRKWFLWFLSYLVASYISAISFLLIRMISYPDLSDWSSAYVGVAAAPLMCPVQIVFAALNGFSGRSGGIDITFFVVVILLTGLTFSILAKRYNSKIEDEC